jgi:hypothetical protein
MASWCGRLLQLDVCLQRIVEAGGEDIDLVGFCQLLAVIDEGEEAGLVVCDGRLTSELMSLPNALPQIGGLNRWLTNFSNSSQVDVP